MASRTAKPRSSSARTWNRAACMPMASSMAPALPDCSGARRPTTSPAPSTSRSRPTRLRLERRRNVVTLFASKDGGPLVELGSIELAPFSPIYAGLGVCAHDDKAETTAIFSDVAIEVLPPPTPAKK